MAEHGGVASEGEVSALQLYSFLIIEGLEGLQIMVVLILCEVFKVLKVNYLLSFLREVELGTLPHQVEGQATGLGCWKHNRMDGALILDKDRFVYLSLF